MTFRFWLNDDHDVLVGGVEQDVQTGNPDWMHTQIATQRDLEDFTRVQIKAPISFDPNDSTQAIKVQFTDVASGTPEINLWKAANPSLDYLTSTTVAQSLVNTTAIGKVDSSAELVIPNDLFNNADKMAALLFDARKTGKGALHVKVYKNGQQVAEDKVWLDLKPITEFFERAHATTARADNRFRLPWEQPHTYVDAIYQPPNVGFANDTPNFQTPQGETQQLIVFVHGFNNTDFEKENWSETMFKRLWHQNFKGRFASFFWPCPIQSESTDIIKSTEFLGLKYGIPLKEYLDDLTGRLNGYTINVTAHSAGNIVMEEALKQGARIDNYVLMQGAVPASSYDLLAHADGDLVAADALSPTPDLAQNLGYRGYLQNIQGNFVNFFNPVDGALQTGVPIGPLGFISISWFKFQEDYKPVNLGGGVHYFYGNDPAVAGSPVAPRLFYKNPPGPPVRRQVTNAHESMAFVARSRTRAIGALGGVHGEITGDVNLNTMFGFTNSRSDHSGEFNRNIQNLNLFYKQLLNSLVPP